MQRMFDGWDYQPNSSDFINLRSQRQAQDFEKKFPFSTHRFDSHFYGKDRSKRQMDWARPGTAEGMNTPVTTRPDVQGSSLVTGVRTVTRSDPRRSEDQLRLAQVRIYYI